jgi:outer membrane receptor protein involved in Fe transport
MVHFCEHALRISGWVILGALGFAATAQMAHADTHRFDVPAGPLGEAMISFGQQANISIGLTDPRLAVSMTHGVKGNYDLLRAIRILLRETGADFEMVGPHSLRIAVAHTSQSHATVPVRRAAPQAPLQGDDIIVTASKQLTSLSNFPASATVISLDSDALVMAATKGTAAIIEQLPMLASTDMGPGRNKIFIRGIADSSFNGATQSATGLYLNDARLTYNSPDPSLNLFDMKQVEVIEGPQGTLYGNGAIGGIIRFVPNAPTPSRQEASYSAGIASTQHGGIGNDLAASLNVPVILDTLAVRAVGYQSVDAGYINDPLRGLNQINRSATVGGRLAIRWTPSINLTVDAGGVYQDIRSADGNYVYVGAPDLVRVSLVAQPFTNLYRLGYLSLKLNADGFNLASTTSGVVQKIGTTYDATDYSNQAILIQNDIPRIFQRNDNITLISHETRLIGTNPDRPWLVGISGLYEVEATNRALGDPAAPAPLAYLRNETGEAALFGEYGLPLASRLKLTFGARATLTITSGQLLDNTTGSYFSVDRTQLRLLPSIALEWRNSGSFVVFGRVSEGARAGGLAVEQSGSTYVGKEFGSDTLYSGEIGFRLGHQKVGGLWLSGTGSYASWRNIQSDLITTDGIPYTVNIGNGYIYSFEGRGGWSPWSRLNLTTAFFVNKSSLTSPIARFASDDGGQSLPNVAGSGAHVDGSYRLPLPRDAALTFTGALRYVGRSQLGIGGLFDPTQGNFMTETGRMRLSWRSFGLSLSVDNIANVRANQFAFGNPFGVAAENQDTPLQPRTIRLGLDGRF